MTTSLNLQKVWTVIEVISSSYAETFWKIKQGMVTTSGKWTVVSSSDGASNFGAADYWVDSGDCVWAITGSNHSWIVLKNTNLSSSGAGFQICIDLDHGTPYYGTVLYSASAGFTGGSLTDRPTATDSQDLKTHSYLMYGYNGCLHISSDGECTRWFGGSFGICTSFWLFDKAKNPSSWWTIPVVVSCRAYNASTTNVLSTDYLSLYGAFYGRVDSFNIPMALLFPSFGAFSGSDYDYIYSYGNNTNFNGDWQVIPGFLAANPIRAGIYGSLYDFFWISSSIRKGTYLPAVGYTKGFICYGDAMVGNDNNRHTFSGNTP